MLSRRQFTAISLATASAPMILSRAAKARTQDVGGVFEWSAIGKNAHLASGGGGNVLYVPGEGGAMLIDTKNAGLADTLRREAESRGGAVTTVINTHHHADHTGGNYAFGVGVETVAYHRATKRIEGQMDRYTGGLRNTIQSGATDDVKREAETRLAEIESLGDAWLPTRSITRRQDVMNIGGRQLVAHHINAGHTDNDLILHLPDENLVHFGDLIFNEMHPYCDASAGVSIGGWIRSLKAGMLIANAKSIVVPGHGPVTDRAGIQRQIDYFEQLIEAVTAEIAKGTERDALTEMHFAFMDGLSFDRIKPLAIGVAYDELIAKKR